MVPKSLLKILHDIYECTREESKADYLRKTFLYESVFPKDKFLILYMFRDILSCEHINPLGRCNTL